MATPTLLSHGGFKTEADVESARVLLYHAPGVGATLDSTLNGDMLVDVSGTTVELRSDVYVHDELISDSIRGTDANYLKRDAFTNTVVGQSVLGASFISSSAISEANAWECVAYSPKLRLFCAVASTGTYRVMTSPDGVTWTGRIAAEQNLFWGICWASRLGLFVAVSGSGTYRVMTSPDGITWTGRSASAANLWRRVCYSPELNLLCAVSSNGYIMRSSDGITWTGCTADTHSWQDVCWSPELGKFVTTTYSSGKVATSTNGITWTSTDAPEANGWVGVCWSPELRLFCSVSNYGTNRAMTSSDGVQWTVHMLAQDSQWRSVCWSSELKSFCAISFDGTDRIMTSSDGAGWVLRPSVSNSGLSHVTWSPDHGIFCIIVQSGINRVLTSQPSFDSLPAVRASAPSSIASSLDVTGTMTSYNGSALKKSAFSSGSVLASRAVSTWYTSNTVNYDVAYSNVCYSPKLRLFCAVSSTGGVTYGAMTTPNGVDFTFASNTPGASWRKVCWAPGIDLFCAISNTAGAGSVMTSPDGVTWTSRTTPNQNWAGICWSPELGMFCGCGYSGTGNRIMTSPDGITWTNQTTPTSPAEYSWYEVCWSAELGLFCAVAGGGVNAAMTSPDGITWTLRSTPDKVWGSVCWSPELRLFCAVAQSGIMISPNGINWTPSTVPGGSTNIWSCVCWSPELRTFCACSASANTSGVMSSPDGVTWTLQTTPNATNSLYGICWAPEFGVFLAVSSAGVSNRVLMSKVVYDKPEPARNMDSSLNVNGVITSYGKNPVNRDAFSSRALGARGVGWWYARTPTATATYISIAWSQQLSMFCVVAASGAGFRVSTSNDGITWTNRNTPMPDVTWTRVCWAPELHLFCAVGRTGTGNRVMTSPDGITWTSRDTTNKDNDWYNVCWSPELGLFCAVAWTGTGTRVMTSPDGITWTLRTSAADQSWLGVCWSRERSLFCAVAYSGSGSNNRIMTSPNGVDWTIRTSPADEQWSNVCWAPELGLFCAVARTGTSRAMTSPDGINWTLRATPAYVWYDVAWSPEFGLFCATANNNVMTSPDGYTWTAGNAAANMWWYGVCWAPKLGVFCSVGEGATRIMTSRCVYDQSITDGTVPCTTLAATGSVVAPLVSASKGVITDGQLLANTKTGVNFYLSGLSTDADYSPVSKTGTVFGDVLVENCLIKMVYHAAAPAVQSYVMYAAGPMVDPGNQGTVRMKIRSASVNRYFTFMRFTNGVDNKSNFELFMGWNTNHTHIRAYDSAGTLILNDAWFADVILNPGVEYDVEFSWNTTAGRYRFYINGILANANGTLSTTFFREPVSQLIIGQTLQDAYWISDYVIYPYEVRPNSVNYTVGETLTVDSQGGYPGGKSVVTGIHSVNPRDVLSAGDAPNVFRGGVYMAKTCIVNAISALSSITIAGGTALGFYKRGTGSLTLGGAINSGSITYYAERIGNMCMVRLSLTGTVNVVTNVITMANIGADFKPTLTTCAPIGFYHSGISTTGAVDFDTNGKLSMYKYDSSNYTNGGSIFCFSTISYMIS